MARPFWSGQIRISLVSFGVKMFPAIEAKNEIRFHQINRANGERVRHQKVSDTDSEPIDNQDIVKGYEYSKGQYVQIEPNEIANLRIPSRDVIEVEQFADAGDLDPALFVKPYFVVPENDAQAQAFAVVRKALQETGKVALGKFATGGREHLLAIGVPTDESLNGMVSYTLRFAEELRRASDYFAEIKKTSVDADQLDLAKELIKRKAGKFELDRYKDEYETALRELVDAKLKNVAVPQAEKRGKPAKVIDLMEALRKSVEAPAGKKPAGDSGGRETPAKHRLEVVGSATKAASKQRKSA